VGAGTGAGTDPGSLLREIGPISRALRHPADIEAVRVRAAESVAVHE
jgi:hypothetical protein